MPYRPGARVWQGILHYAAWVQYSNSNERGRKCFKVRTIFSSVVSCSFNVTDCPQVEYVHRHVAIIKLHKTTMQVEKVRLRTVRPFVMADLVLADIPRIRSNDMKTAQKHITQRIEQMVAQAHAEWDTMRTEAIQRGEVSGDDPLLGEEAEPPLPLIRLRIEYTGFTTINPQQFGQKFVGPRSRRRTPLSRSLCPSWEFAAFKACTGLAVALCHPVSHVSWESLCPSILGWIKLCAFRQCSRVLSIQRERYNEVELAFLNLPFKFCPFLFIYFRGSIHELLHKHCERASKKNAKLNSVISPAQGK